MQISNKETWSSSYQPLITVVTVVRNGEKTIQNTIDSIAKQTFDNFEYIIIDGESTDSTTNIIKDNSKSIFKCISEPDNGIYDAMNKGISLASGKWLIFIGADDVLVNNEILSKVSNFLQYENCIYYGDVLLKSSNKRYCGPISTYKLMQQNICHQAIFYPSSLYKKKKYDIHSGLLADYKYNIEVWASSFQFIYIPIIITIFSDTGASSNPGQHFESMRLKLIYENFGRKWYLIKRTRNMFRNVFKALKS